MPKYQVVIINQNEWFNKNIFRALKRRDNFLKKFTLTRTENNLPLIKFVGITQQKLIKNTKRDYYKHKLVRTEKVLRKYGIL